MEICTHILAQKDGIMPPLSGVYLCCFDGFAFCLSIGYGVMINDM
jgi:hypothetical protein